LVQARPAYEEVLKAATVETAAEFRPLLSVVQVAQPADLTLRAASARPSLYRLVLKRCLDFCVALILLIALAPAIVALAVAVAVTSGWPAFYRSRRVGRGGSEFSMWKLRTMVRDADAVLARWRESNPTLAAEYARNFKLAADPRVTPLGRFLRRTSLDELPQLWNVVRGDMSLVGPRPVSSAEMAHYGDQWLVLLSVRPGITGVWQVGVRNATPYPERARIELAACRSSTFLGDLVVLLKTLRAPFTMGGL
jgi:exopolysaccharide production protein ExoY